MDEGVNETGIAENEARLNTTGCIGSNDGFRSGKLDFAQFCSSCEQGIRGNSQTWCDHTSKILSISVDHAKRRRCAKIDDDEITAKLLIGGSRIHNTVT